MYWQDEGYLLSKNNFGENSIIIEALTSQHGKSIGIVYGGTSRKNKRNFQIGNKILLNWKSKSENKTGYFNIELIKAISPLFFDNKKKSICILSASSLLKIFLPERQIHRNIFVLYENFLDKLNSENWINRYILWELSLIKELGFEVDLINSIKSSDTARSIFEINGKSFKIPKLLQNENENKQSSNEEIKEALNFNKNLMKETIVTPSNLRFPISRNILEMYYN